MDKALTIAGGRDDGASGTGVSGIETPSGCDGWASEVPSWVVIVKKVVKSTEGRYMVFARKIDREKERWTMCT